uniref:RING-type domain-containing protein n=1 Tax=Panagrellus redivivus TaxID=6233 RepID=A0A7E4VL66_PANRE
MSDGSSNEERECPICLEELEPDDLYFYPCECKYQVCRFCWHRIRNDENGLCPACRRQYKENSLSFQPAPREAKPKRQRKERKEKEQTASGDARKHLADVRILQRNLVYVVGLPSRMSDADLLRKNEFFGKYGKVSKLIVGTLPSNSGAGKRLNTAYVTYAKEEDALRAIHGTSNLYLDGKWVKTTLGTTKYCSNYLRNTACFRSDCMYLHDPAPPEISFSKEDMQANKHLNYEQRLIEEFVKRDSGCRQPVLPPPTVSPKPLLSVQVAPPRSETLKPPEEPMFDITSPVSVLEFPSINQDLVNVPPPKSPPKPSEQVNLPSPIARPSPRIEPLMDLKFDDDDLDFDPFSEAMRGLEELIHEAEQCDAGPRGPQLGSSPPGFSRNSFAYTSLPMHYGPPPGFSNAMNAAFPPSPPGFFDYPPMSPTYAMPSVPTSSNYYVASPQPQANTSNPTQEPNGGMFSTWRSYIPRLF